jgi:hypothetical protein
VPGERRADLQRTSSDATPSHSRTLENNYGAAVI